MKKIMHPRAALLAAIIAVVLPVSGRAQVIVGTGPDVVNLVIQADWGGKNQPTTTLWYQYRYDDANFSDPKDPLRGSDVLVAVTGSDLSKLTLENSGEPDSGFFLNSLAYNGGQPLSFVDDPIEAHFLTWTYFVSGGAVNKLDGFSPIDVNGVPVAESVPAGTWSLSPVGASLRYPVNGSWDALVFGAWNSDAITYEGNQPAISPVPEPRAVALLLGGMIVLVIRLIRRGGFARAGA